MVPWMSLKGETGRAHLWQDLLWVSGTIMDGLRVGTVRRERGLDDHVIDASIDVIVAF